MVEKIHDQSHSSIERTMRVAAKKGRFDGGAWKMMWSWARAWLQEVPLTTLRCRKMISGLLAVNGS